jgi:hypothetical protein
LLALTVDRVLAAVAAVVLRDSQLVVLAESPAHMPGLLQTF